MAGGGAHGLVAQLGDNGGSGSAERGGGRHGELPVGGELHAHGEAVENVVSTVDNLALQVAVIRVVDIDFHDLARVQRGEHGAAHILARREAEDFTVAHDGGGAVQGPAHGEGQADDGEYVAALSGCGYTLEPFHRGVGEMTLEVEVTAGRARKHELGEHQQLYSGLLRLSDAVNDLVRVVRGVGHPDFRRRRGYFQKSILHFNTSP